MMLTGALSAVALVAIWIGYPALIRVLAMLCSQRPAVRHYAPQRRVSVILAARATPTAVQDRVADLLHADYPANLLEVVVALDGANARDIEAARQGLPANATVLTADAPGGKAAALNAAVRHATGEILVFADVAQRFHPSAIAELVASLDEPSVGAVSGRLELPASDEAGSLAARYWRFERWLRAWEARVHSCVGVTGAIYAMRRSLWRELPPGLILDDLYGPMRLVIDGWRVGYAERARAIDSRHFEPGDEFRRKVRTLTGVVQVCAWLPAVLHPVHNPVWVQFLMHKVMRLLTPYLVLLAVLGLGGASVEWAAVHGIGTAVASGTAAGIALALAVPRLRRMLAHQLRWNVALQGSAAVAAYYGLRGRWNVWR